MSPNPHLRRGRAVLLAAVIALQINGVAHALILGDSLGDSLSDSLGDSLGDPVSMPAPSLSAGNDPNSVLSAWSSVGSVSVAAGVRTLTFSGVLIDRRHVLTAAHVAGVAAHDITFNLNHGGNLTHRIPAATVTVHPDYSGFDPRRPHDDLAVIRLARDAPADIPIYSIYRGALARGELVTLVGYGGGGNGVNGATVPPDPAVKRVGYNRADVFVVDDEGSGRHEIYHFDFDGPDPTTNRMGGLTLGGNLEASVAGGDSGSPAFVHERGTWWLAGINTFAWSAPDGRSGVFGAGGGGVLLSAYGEWIDGVVNARDEPPPRDSYVLGLLGAAGIACTGLFVALRSRKKSA